jgi:all-trans-retinol 13,14-reductase
MNRYDFILIGSGLGSLLCAYILSKEGFHVCVLEKQPVTGGCLQSFSRGQDSFDTGIHYIGSMLPGQTLHSYWKYFGLSQCLDLVRLDENCFDLISFDDGDFPLAQGFDNFRQQLLSHFPGSSLFLQNYIASVKKTVASFPLYNLELPRSHTETKWMGRNAFEFLGSLPGSGTGEKKLSEIIAGNNFLYAGKRESTPWHQYALINHSFISSAWRIRHGGRQVADHLIGAIKANGGSVMTKKDVKHVSHLKDKFQVRTTDEDIFVAGRIIAGIHPQAAIRLLEPSMIKRSFVSRIMGMENTVSSFALYIGLKPGSFPYMNYNVYYHKSHDVWADQDSKGDQWPSMYFMYTPFSPGSGIHASSLCLMSYMRFDEFSRWQNSITGKRGKEYRNFKHEHAEKLLVLAERRFPGLKAAVSSLEISTPLTWRDYTGTPEGSMYGIRKESGNYLKTMILPHTKIHGFYFTGQNLNMHGVPGVTIGSIMTCAEILGMEYLFKKLTDAV